MTPEATLLAFQLSEFVRSNHPFVTKVRRPIREVINYIVHRFDPPFEQDRLTKVRNTRSASTDSDNQNQDLLDWAADKYLLRYDIDKFNKLTLPIGKYLNGIKDISNLPAVIEESSTMLGSLQGPGNNDSHGNSGAGSNNSPINDTSNLPFSQAQINAITIMLDVALDKRDRRREEHRRQSSNRHSLERYSSDRHRSNRHPSRSRRQAAGDNPDRPRTPEIDDKFGNGRNRWNSNDLRFFDPMYDSKLVSTGSTIEQNGRETIFRDVYLFVDRAQ